MADFCRNCGAKLTEGTAFCPHCGTRIAPVTNTSPQPAQAPVQQPRAYMQQQQVPVQQQPAYGQPMQQAPVYAPAPQPKQKASHGHKKSTRALAVILTVVLVIEGTIAGLWFPGFLRLQKKQSAWLSVDKPVTTLCGVTMDADTYNLKDGKLKATVADYGKGKKEDGSTFRHYSISLGEQSEYTAAVALTFPCEGDPNEVVITHQDHETGEWMPMIGFPDEEAGTITVFTDSFSEFRAENPTDSPLFFVADEGTPNATIQLSPNALKIIGKTDSKIIESSAKAFAANPGKYKVDMGENSGAGTARDFLINSMGPLAEVVGGAAELQKTPLELMINGNTYEYTGSAFKADLNTAATAISLYTIGIQLAKDIKQHGINADTTVANLMKNLASNSGTFYSMATGYGNASFTFTFFGVALIGMGLDHMTDTAKAEQQKYMKKLMDYYYSKVKPFDADEWYEKYNAICRDRMLPVGQAIKELGFELDAYSKEFWTAIEKQSGKEFENLLLEAGIKNIYKVDAAKKQQLINYMKYTVRQKFNDEVMPKIEEDLIAKQQASVTTQLKKMAEPFNKKLFFNVAEHSDMNTTEQTKYNGCTIAFGGKDFVQKDEAWLLHAPESESEEWNDSWQVSFEATDYAWMKAGLPDTVYVFLDDSELNGDPLTTMKFKQPHKEPNRTANINLAGAATYAWSLKEIDINPNYEPGGDEKVLDWSGDIQNLHITWQEKLDGEIVEYTDNNFSAGQTIDYPENFRFVSVYDETTAKYSERSHSSSLTINFNGNSTSASQSRYVENGEIGAEYAGGKSFPRALEGRSFNVTVNRGIYSLVYKYKAVIVEEADKYSANIINNCINDPKDDVFTLNGKWQLSSKNGYYQITVTEKAIQVGVHGIKGMKETAGKAQAYTFANGKLRFKKQKSKSDISLEMTGIDIIDENHIVFHWEMVYKSLGKVKKQDQKLTRMK